MIVAAAANTSCINLLECEHRRIPPGPRGRRPTRLRGLAEGASAQVRSRGSRTMAASVGRYFMSRWVTGSQPSGGGAAARAVVRAASQRVGPSSGGASASREAASAKRPAR